MMKRRDVLKLMGAAPAAAAFTWTSDEALEAASLSARAKAQAVATNQPYTPRFFTAHEFATVVALGDLIIPKDAHSGSASDAGAPEFIDYLIAAQSDRQTSIRGGLGWLDSECRGRFDKTFLDATDAERRAVLDDIAWPAKAQPRFSQGVRFFSTMRDLVAGGFWSSKIGVEDIGYIGNRPVAEWTGAPPEVLRKLNVSYD